MVMNCTRVLLALHLLPQRIAQSGRFISTDESLRFSTWHWQGECRHRAPSFNRFASIDKMNNALSLGYQKNKFFNWLSVQFLFFWHFTLVKLFLIFSFLMIFDCIVIKVEKIITSDMKQSSLIFCNFDKHKKNINAIELYAQKEENLFDKENEKHDDAKRRNKETTTMPKPTDLFIVLINSFHCLRE